MPENVRQCPIPTKDSAQSPPPPPLPPLSPQQQVALRRLLAGEPLGDIARALQIDPRTLYRWRHHHPAFAAELTRLQRDLWSDIADALRMTVAAGVDKIREHLSRPNDMTQLRAARLLINLVNAPRLAPTGPTTVEGVLDEMLRQSAPPPSTPEVDAQRRALLDRLMADPDVNPPT
jgi:transposase-like protein